MGQLTPFEAAQLSEHAWVVADVKNACCELDREETVNDCCEWHPLAGPVSGIRWWSLHYTQCRRSMFTTTEMPHRDDIPLRTVLF